MILVTTPFPHQSSLDWTMSHARRDAKGDKSSDYTIEEQVVLRVPPAIAEAVRAILSGKERDLTFVMGTFVSLPPMVASHSSFLIIF